MGPEGGGDLGVGCWIGQAEIGQGEVAPEGRGVRRYGAVDEFLDGGRRRVVSLGGSGGNGGILVRGGLARGVGRVDVVAPGPRGRRTRAGGPVHGRVGRTGHGDSDVDGLAGDRLIRAVDLDSLDDVHLRIVGDAAELILLRSGIVVVGMDVAGVMHQVGRGHPAVGDAAVRVQGCQVALGGIGHLGHLVAQFSIYVLAIFGVFRPFGINLGIVDLLDVSDVCHMRSLRFQFIEG